MKYHVVLSLSSPVSDITNDLFSENICPSISECSDSRSVNLNTGLAASVTDTIIQHEYISGAREIINNKQNKSKRFHDRTIDTNKFLQGCVSKTVILDLGNEL